MPRQCQICIHPDREAIDRCLVDSVPFRIIANRYSVSVASLQRHNEKHLPERLAQAKEAEEVAAADNLLAQMQALHRKSLAILTKAEGAGDLGMALRAIKEARGCITTLLEVEGKLDRRPTMNVVLSPQWVELRAVIIGALHSHPEAAQAVATALVEVEGGVSHAAD